MRRLFQDDSLGGSCASCASYSTSWTGTVTLQWSLSKPWRE